MKSWVWALLITSIFTISASYAEDLESYRNLTISEVKAEESKHPNAFEWQDAKFYMNITPKVFLRRSYLNDDPFKYLNIVADISVEDIEQLWEYVQRDELYKHDFTVLESFLKDTRFAGRFFVYNQLHTKAPFEIDKNLKEGYALLKKYDSESSTTYSQKYSLAYLLRMFSQPRGIMITSVSSTMLSDFLVHIDSYEESLAKEVLQVVQAGIRYYNARLSQASGPQVGIIHGELLALSDKSLNLAKKHGDPYTQKIIQQTFQDTSEIANKKGLYLFNEEKKGSLSGEQLADINQHNNLRTFVSNFVKDVFNDPRKKTDDVKHQDSTVRMTAKKYTPRTTKGNIVSLSSTKERTIQETIFTVNVVIPGVHSAEAVSLVTSILLATPQVYGVYFDHRIRIPSSLNQRDFEITNIGNEVLIRKKPNHGACKREFTP